MRGVVVQAPGRGGRGEPPDVGGVRANPPTERPGGDRGGAPVTPRSPSRRGSRPGTERPGDWRTPGGARSPPPLRRGAEVLRLWRRPPPHRPQNDERSGGVPGRATTPGRAYVGSGGCATRSCRAGSNARPPGSAAAPWRPCASPLSPQLMPRRPRCSSASTIQRWLSICSRRSRIGTAACDSPLSRTARPRS